MSAVLILERIQQEEDRLSIQQKRVAQYILQDCGEAAFMTAAKLAEASGVSEATVIRFANRMGYGRYSQLQEELRMVVRTRLSQTERLHRTADLRHHSSIMRTAIRSMRTDMHNIEQTLLALAEDSLREVVELLADGEYQAVYDLFREDIRSTLTVEQIQALFQEVLEEAGALEGLDDSRVQGSTEGEPHGIAELYYDFAHDTVRFRVAFDLELQLIGVDAPRVL